MKKESEYIDQLFRENQNRFDRQPSARVWRRLEDRLDAQKPLKSKRKSFHLNWMIAASTLFVMLLPAYFLLHYWHKPWHKEMASADSAVMNTPGDFSASPDSSLPAPALPSFASVAETAAPSSPASVPSIGIPPAGSSPKPSATPASSANAPEMTPTPASQHIHHKVLVSTSADPTIVPPSEDNDVIAAGNETMLLSSSAPAPAPSAAMWPAVSGISYGNYIPLPEQMHNGSNVAASKMESNKRRGAGSADEAVASPDYPLLHCEVHEGLMNVSLTYPDGAILQYAGTEINGRWLLSNTQDGSNKLQVSVIDTRKIALFFFENPDARDDPGIRVIYVKEP